MADAASLVARVTADTSAAESTLGKFGGSLGGVASNLTSVLGGAAAAGGAAVAAGLAVGVKAAGDLEQAVASISTIKPEIDTSAVFDSLNELSTRVPQTAEELGDALYDVFSSISDITAEQGLKLAETFAKGAVGAQTDAKTFGTAISGIMNAYKLDVGDATDVSDMFFATVRDGVVTGPELAASLGPVTQAAKAAGVEWKDLGPMIAAATKEGGPAAQNINNLNNLFMKFTTEQAQTAMQDMGIATKTSTGEFRNVPDVLRDVATEFADLTEAERANAMQTIFPDAQARQGAQTLISQLDFVDKALADSSNNMGLSEQAYTKMSATFNSQSKLFMNTVTAALTAIGAEVLPAITPMLTAFSAQLPAAMRTATAAISTFKQAFAGNWRPDGVDENGNVIWIDPMIAKVGEIGTIAGESWRTFTAALAGNWRPDGVDEAGNVIWIDPFVKSVGNAGVEIKKFFDSFTSPEVAASTGQIVTNLRDMAVELDKLGKSGGGTGLKWVGDNDISDIAKLAAQVTAFAANFVDLANTLKTMSAGIGHTVKSFQQTFAGDWLGASESTTAAVAEFEKVPGIFDAYMNRSRERMEAASGTLGAAATDTFGTISAAATESLNATSENVTEGLNVTSENVIAGMNTIAGDFSGGWDGIAVDTTAQVELLPPVVAESMSVMDSNVTAGFGTLAGDFSTGWDLIVADAGELLPGIPAAMAAQEAPMGAAAAALGTALETPTAASILAAVANAETSLPGIPAAVTAQDAVMTSAATALGVALQSPVDTAVLATIAATEGSLPGIPAAVTAQHAVMTSAATTLGEQLSAPLAAGVDAAISETSANMPGVTAAVAAEQTPAAEAGRGVGQGIVDGLGNALSAGMGWIRQQAASLAQAASAAAREALGERSPSQEFYEIGEGVIEGFVNALSSGDAAVASAIRTIVEIAIAQGIDPIIALALAKMESSFNTNAVGDDGESVGLYQLHARGQGAGMSSAERMDAATNAAKFLSAAHAELFQSLKASGLAGRELAEVFGNLAEVSADEAAYLYGDAYEWIVEQLGKANINASALTGTTTRLGAANQASGSSTRALGQDLQYNAAWVATMADQAAKLAQVMSGQVDPATTSTKDAMSAFGAVLGPIEREVAAGSISAEALQVKMVDLARATGIATEPWARFTAGEITAEEAMRQVINSAADAGPQFDELRKYVNAAGVDSTEATLRFLQLGLGLHRVEPAATAVKASISGLGTVQGQAAIQTKSFADQEAALAEVLSGQVDPTMIQTTQAMANFGAVLGPVERQVAGGAISIDTLRVQLVDLARATGIATEPWARFSAGTITAEEAMRQVINSAADAGPQFDELRKYVNSAGADSTEATLRFLQLGLGLQRVAPDATAATTAIGELGTAQQQVALQTKSFADQQVALSTVMSGQVDPATTNTKDAMSAFGAVLGPIERQVASGTSNLNWLQVKMVDLARAVGIATEPWDRYAAGTITADEAMRQVINSAADAGPQFDELRKYVNAAGSDSAEAALRFLQLGLGLHRVEPGATAAKAAITGLGTAQGQAAIQTTALTAEQAELSTVLRAVEPATINTKSAMSLFGAVLGPVERQVAAGTNSLSNLQVEMVDLARFVGIATEPWARYAAGTITADEAMKQVINSAADAGPQFDELRKAVNSGSISSAEASLQFIQLGLNFAKSGQGAGEATAAAKGLDSALAGIHDRVQDAAKALMPAGTATSIFSGVREMVTGVANNFAGAAGEGVNSIFINLRKVIQDVLDENPLLTKEQFVASLSLTGLTGLFAHEIAHNLFPEHGAEHSALTEAILARLPTDIGTQLVEPLKASLATGDFDDLFAPVTASVDGFSDAITALPDQVSEPITTATATMNTALAGTSTVATTTQGQISDVFQTLLTQISTTLTGMAEQMRTNWAAMLSGSQTAWQGMVTAIQSATANTISTIAVMVQTVMGLSDEQTEAVVTKALEMSGGVLTQIRAMATGSVATTRQMSTDEVAAAAAAATGVIGSATTMQTGAVGQATTMAGGVGESFDTMQTGATASMEEFSAAILGALSTLETSAATAGRAVGVGIGDGVADGLRSTLSSVQDAANAIVDEVDAALRAKAEIRSPSRVFAWHGQMMARGVTEGMNAGLRGFNAELPGLRGGLASGYGNSGGGSSSGSAVIDYDRFGAAVARASSSQGDTINVSGAGTEEVVTYLQRRDRRNQLLHPRRSRS